MKNTIPVVIGIGLVFAALAASAQQFQWPEEPENLQVLPEGTKGTQLGMIMRGFSQSLDVRCDYCHVGEGNDLTQYDFVSDDKAAKRKTRLMLEMVQSINMDHIRELSSVEDEKMPTIEVNCMTCHRKQARPRMLADVLTDTLTADGTDAAVDRYHELREQYYGGFTYDFSPGTLTRMGEELGRAGDHDSGVRFVELEIEMNGESPMVYFTLGGIQAAGGMTEDAVQSLGKGMEIAPERFKPFFQAELDKLTGGSN